MLSVESVKVRGKMHHISNPMSTFHGSIKGGMRPIIWYSKPHLNSTSCHILTNIEILQGETKEVDIVILNQLQIEKPIVKGMVLNVGTPYQKIAEFTVEKYLGVWEKGNFDI